MESIWRHLAAGNVTLLSSDHVSWSLDRKTDPDMLANASGLPGLETMLPLFVKGSIERGVSLTWAARLMASNPARHFRIDHVKGALEVGKDADIAVLTPEPIQYESAMTGHSVSGWSPFDGTILPYRVSGTYVRGRQAFDGRGVHAKLGDGNFVRPPKCFALANNVQSQAC